MTLKESLTALVLAIGLAVGAAPTEDIVLRHGKDSCVVNRLGARIVSYRTKLGEALWMPAGGLGKDDVWRHGGLPIAWPWFGRIGMDSNCIHGYAWKSPFRVKAQTADSVVLDYRDESAELEYEIRLTDRLEMRLRTTNRTAHYIAFSTGYHPYFLVGERDSVMIEGVEPEPIAVTRAMDDGKDIADRVHAFLIRDCALGRTIRVEAENLTRVNVWNPGNEFCRDQLADGDWRHFVAVEPMAMGNKRMLSLAPGQSYELKMSVGLEKP